MKIPEQRTDPMIVDWLKAIKAKKTTSKSYLLGIQDYTEFTGKTPDELIEEA